MIPKHIQKKAIIYNGFSIWDINNIILRFLHETYNFLFQANTQLY